MKKWLPTLFLALALSAAGADKAHTVRTAQVREIKAEWRSNINALYLDFYDDQERWMGGAALFLPENLSVKSGKAVTVKDLNGACLRSISRPFEMSGPRVLRMVKEFSAELKRGGQMKFSIVGKETLDGQEWDFDVRGEARISEPL